MIFAKINAEKADSLIAKQYKVSAYPTFVVTDSKGEEIDRIVGYLPAEPFMETVSNYIQGIGTLADLLAKAVDSTDREIFYEIADKYKYRGGPEEAKIWYQKVIDAGDPKDSLSAESRFSLADMYRRAKDYETAASAYQAIKADFTGTTFEQDADIWTAIVYRQQGDTTKAIGAFEQYVKDYPESEDIDYATRQISKLKGEEEVKPTE